MIVIHLLCRQIQFSKSCQVSNKNFWRLWWCYICINFYWRYFYSIYWYWNCAWQWCWWNFYYCTSCHFLVSCSSFNKWSCWSIRSILFISGSSIWTFIHINSHILISSNIYRSIVFNNSTICHNYTFYSCSICCRRSLNYSVVFSNRISVNVHSSRIFSIKINSSPINRSWSFSNGIHSNTVFLRNIYRSIIFNRSYIWCCFCGFIIIPSRHSNSILFISYITCPNCNRSIVFPNSLRWVNSYIPISRSQVNISIIYWILRWINSISVIFISHNIRVVFNFST